MDKKVGGGSGQIKRGAGAHHLTARASSGNYSSTRTKPPGWAKGLQQLYDSVVDEPLPDAFEDLLRQLDGKTG